MGTWAGRTPSSTPRGRWHHERRGPCQGGARGMVRGGRQASTLPAAELTQGSRGQADHRLNLSPLHWDCGVLATGPPGKSLHSVDEVALGEPPKDGSWLPGEPTT